MRSQKVLRKTKKGLNPTSSDRTCPPCSSSSSSTERQTSQSPNAAYLLASRFTFFPAPEISPQSPRSRRGPDQPGRGSRRPRASRSRGRPGRAAAGRRPHRPGTGASPAQRGRGRGRYWERTAREGLPRGGKAPRPGPLPSRRRAAARRGEARRGGSGHPAAKRSGPPRSPAPRGKALQGARGARGRGGRSRSLRPRRPPLIQSRARTAAAAAAAPPPPPPPAPPSRPPVTRETGPPLPAAPLPLAPPTAARAAARGSRPEPLGQRPPSQRAGPGRRDAASPRCGDGARQAAEARRAAPRPAPASSLRSLPPSFPPAAAWSRGSLKPDFVTPGNCAKKALFCRVVVVPRMWLWRYSLCGSLGAELWVWKLLKQKCADKNSFRQGVASAGSGPCQRLSLSTPMLQEVVVHVNWLPSGYSVFIHCWCSQMGRRKMRSTVKIFPELSVCLQLRYILRTQ